jgi:hypothetical protein
MDYADRIKPLSEYNVRILTYNEDGNGGYQLYQVANYDTAKNEYVMGIAVHGDNGDFVVHKDFVQGSNSYVKTTYDKTQHLGYENTQTMLEAYPDDANDYVHNRCHKTSFADGSKGYLMSYGEGLDIWRRKDAISNAAIKINSTFDANSTQWTSSWGHEGNKWMGIIRFNQSDEASVISSTGSYGSALSYKNHPITKFPEGVEW